MWTRIRRTSRTIQPLWARLFGLCWLRCSGVFIHCLSVLFRGGCALRSSNKLRPVRQQHVGRCDPQCNK
jgi:hypothetical protein